MSDIHEIRALLAPMPGGNLLLPGSAVAEVIAYEEPEAFPNAPEWLLGEVKWNGWQIPVVNFALLAETSHDTSVAPRSRVLVVKTLSDSASIVHVGLVINGLPRLRNVTTSNLSEQSSDEGPGVFSHVSIDDEAAVIPDLPGLAMTIEDAVYRH